MRTMPKLALEEAQTRLEERVAEVAEGEEVVIVREDGKAFKIVPAPAVSAKIRRIIGIARGQIRMSDDFDAPLELEACER